MAINTYAFAVNHTEAATLIANCGADVSYVFEGEPGVGKSSVLRTLTHLLGDAYDYVYVDVPLKDIPQVALSMPDHVTRTTIDYVHSIWKGTSDSKPKIVMLDEIGKGQDYVKLMMNRLLLEHMVGDYKLPDGSIVFGTTNYATDGVGDRANAHTNSRIVSVPFRKPTQDEWVHWATNNDISPLVLTWVNQNPMLFQSYKDTEFDASLHRDGEGPFHYIFHPQHNNRSYVCPRTLAMASHQVHKMEHIGEALLTKALIGTIGSKAALDLSAMIALGSDLPHPKDIITAPDSARVPKSGPAQLLMVYKSMQFLKPDNVDAFATYFKRFPLEVTSTWVKTIVGIEAIKQFALKNQSIREFAVSNAWVL